MHNEINTTIDIKHYNIGILKGQFKMIYVIFNFHNTEGNFQCKYQHAIWTFSYMYVLFKIPIDDSISKFNIQT